MKGGSIRRFTFEDRVMIESCLKQGLDYRQIGLKLDRSLNVIQQEICKHGGRMFYSAKDIHDRINSKFLVSKDLEADKKTYNLTLRDILNLQYYLRQGLPFEKIAIKLAIPASFFGEYLKSVGGRNAFLLMDFTKDTVQEAFIDSFNQLIDNFKKDFFKLVTLNKKDVLTHD